MKKSDLLASILIAELDAWLIILIAKNIGWEFSFIKFLPLTLPILTVAGLFIAVWLGKKILTIFQLYKFVLTGTLNTFIDLGVLNLLILIFGIASGAGYSIFKGISFVIAAINSYFWNKFWTFKKQEINKIRKRVPPFSVISSICFGMNIGMAFLLYPQSKLFSAAIIGIAIITLLGVICKPKNEFIQFFIITITSFSINVGTASSVVNLVDPQFGCSPKMWANVGAIVATFVALTWNFIGYKFIVFKK